MHAWFAASDEELEDASEVERSYRRSPLTKLLLEDFLLSVLGLSVTLVGLLIQMVALAP